MPEPTSEPSTTSPAPTVGPRAAGAEPVGRPRTAVMSATVAVLALVGGWTWAAAVQSGGFDARAESISALAASGTPHRWIMTTALVLTGLAHLVTAWALVPARRPGRVLLAAGGVATLAVAAFPLPSRTGSSAVHTAVATLSFALLAVWPWFAARPRRPGGPGAAGGPAGRRGARRGGRLARDRPRRHRVRRPRARRRLPHRGVAARHGGQHVVVGRAPGRLATRAPRARAPSGWSLACGVAGTSATAIAPATAQTRHYQASVALDPNPLRTGELVATTAFGDLRLEFQGVAPGIRAVPQVKANIAEVLSRPGVSLASLRPGPEELSAAIRDVAQCRDAALRARCARRRRRGARRVRRAPPTPRRPPRSWWPGSSAWLASTALTGLALYTTYQPGRQETFTSTGVLGTLQRNQGILSDVETRATQVAPYLRNLIALSTALQQKYEAAPLQSDTSLRVLLVSDIHAGNQYDLMRTIVQEEGVDVVVDAGDLVNFGTVEEAEATGLFTGIASVGVPYLFVRGNHDANSATDTALLDRLARIPNVTLLQDGAGDYTEVTVHGVRIAGFNDPRWFGDSGTGSPAKQAPAREAFTAAYAGRPAADLVVGHEPWSVEGLAGGVLVNGHMHSVDLEGNRVQAGTFTGGGPFTHFLADSGVRSWSASPPPSTCSPSAPTAGSPRSPATGSATSSRAGRPTTTCRSSTGAGSTGARPTPPAPARSTPLSTTTAVPAATTGASAPASP